VGIAAKLGRAHVAFWAGAMVLFYLPLAAVVIWLNRMMPLEGGLYQWAKLGFGELAGFLTAWNLWVYAVIVAGAIVFVVPTDLAYMIGPAAAWLPASKLGTLLLTGTVMAAIALAAVRGLDVSKWLHNAGSVLIMLAYAILLTLPLWAPVRPAARYEPIPWAPPRPGWFSLAVFGQMTVGALSGFEYVAILAGECRSAARTIGAVRNDLGAGDLPDVHPGHQFGAGVCGRAADQRDRADSADHAGGFRQHGRGRLGRAVRDAGACHCDCQPDLHRVDALAHDGRVGPPDARLVHAPGCAARDSGELDPVCGGAGGIVIEHSFPRDRGLSDCGRHQPDGVCG
jgi:hypothetical protein